MEGIYVANQVARLHLILLFCAVSRRVKLLIFKDSLSQKKGSMMPGGRGKDFKHYSNNWRLI